MTRREYFPRGATWKGDEKRALVSLHHRVIGKPFSGHASAKAQQFHFAIGTMKTADMRHYLLRLAMA